MVNIKINNEAYRVEEGTSVLEAARQAGLDIPALCYYEGIEHFTSCMICLVKDNKSGRLYPSCSHKVYDGMEVVTDDEEITEARKTGLELLLSEHIGDCEAPCTIACPAGMNIPLMNRLLEAGEMDKALEVVRKDIALPAVLGRICPAPCEGACKRKPIDEAVSICLLKRYAGDHGKPDFERKQSGKVMAENDTSGSAQPLTGIKPMAEDKKVAVIGAGPGGLAAAYYLQLEGIVCEIFDQHEQPGGNLRYAVPEDRLPKDVLDREIQFIKDMGVQFRQNTTVDRETFNRLVAEYDAVVIATGDYYDEVGDWLDGFPKNNEKGSPGNTHQSKETKQDGNARTNTGEEREAGADKAASQSAVQNAGKAHKDQNTDKTQSQDSGTAARKTSGKKQLPVDKTTFQTSRENVFAVGNVTRSSKMAIRSLGQGKDAAYSIMQYLHGEKVNGKKKKFNSKFGKLIQDEFPEYLKESTEFKRFGPKKGLTEGFTLREMVNEASRCMHCDCRKIDNCKLRDFADDYQARQKRFDYSQRKPVKKFIQEDVVVYEPGKCIKCGICVRLTARYKEELGLTFIGRGFDVEVGVPFNEELKNGLAKTAVIVAEACPTGALSLIR